MEIGDTVKVVAGAEKYNNQRGIIVGIDTINYQGQEIERMLVKGNKFGGAIKTTKIDGKNVKIISENTRYFFPWMLRKVN